MKITGIQWTHSTVNPTSGCDGCELLDNGCYAQVVHENRLALGPLTARNYAKRFTEVRTIAGRMAEAAAWGPVTDKEAAGKPWFATRRRHIFVSDMSDALSRAVPFEYLQAEIVDQVTSEKGRRHVWQWLTKRPQRMAEFDRWLAARGIAWPENLWAGTSVTSQRTADQRVPYLLTVRAAVRFLSCEPLFEAVDLTRIVLRASDAPERGKPDTSLDCLRGWHGGAGSDRARIAWVIVGGMSGAEALPFDLDWARSLRDQCAAAGVACFVKQLGRIPVELAGNEIARLNLSDAHGGEMSEWPADLRVRQVPALSAAEVCT